MTPRPVAIKRPALGVSFDQNIHHAIISRVFFFGCQVSRDLIAGQIQRRSHDHATPVTSATGGPLG